MITSGLQLAALQFKKNSGREQETHWEELYDISFPKFKIGGNIVQKVVVDPTYGE